MDGSATGGVSLPIAPGRGLAVKLPGERLEDFRPFEIYTAAMLVYFLICYPTARGIDRIYRRLVPLGAS